MQILPKTLPKAEMLTWQHRYGIIMVRNLPVYQVFEALAA
jgi:hypothetical protein